MCSQNTGKFAKGYTFLITITENSGLALDEIVIRIKLIK